MMKKLRRALSMGVLALLLVVGGAAAMWKFYVPHYRPSLRAGETYGLDVSHHQGKIDWVAVAQDGVSFAYVKASEGGDFRDVSHLANIEAARRNGIRVGAYHFFTFCNSGVEQAANFLAASPPDAERLAPAVDVEFAGNCSKRPPRDELLNELQAFVSTVEAAWGRPVITYILPDAENHYGINKELVRRRWQRSIFRRPNNDDWDVWQVSGMARVDGVDGPVDLNVGRLDPSP
jgi:lysozyme